MNTPTKLSTHMFNSYGIDLLETDEHDITSICNQHRGNNDAMFKELREHLLSEHRISPPHDDLERIAELCQKTDKCLFNYLSNSYNLYLREMEQDEIIRICKQIIAERTESDTRLSLLCDYLNKKHGLYLPDFKLSKIVNLFEEIGYNERTDYLQPDTEPLKFQRPMTEKVFIAIIKDSRRDVLNNPKYFCYKWKYYLKLKRLKAKYKKQAIKLCQSTNS